MSPLALQQSAHSSRAALSLHSLTVRHVLRCPRLARLLGLVLLVGLSACGSPSPDGPVSSPTTGSADAVVSSPAGAGPGANDLRRPGAPATTRPGASNPDTAQPAPEARVPSAASPANPPPSDAQTPAEQAQREARELWFAERRAHPDATVRLQALALWAQQPGEGIDPLTYALVDEDEDVRTRAQELWEQQLTREDSVP